MSPKPFHQLQHGGFCTYQGKVFIKHENLNTSNAFNFTDRKPGYIDPLERVQPVRSIDHPDAVPADRIDKIVTLYKNGTYETR